MSEVALCKSPGCPLRARAPQENPVACYDCWWALGAMTRRWLVKQYSTSEVRPAGSYERALCMLRQDWAGLTKLLALGTA